MALSTYTELKNSVSAWLTRTGDTALIALIPDFIALAEDEFNKNLRIREMEVRETKTISKQYIELPDGYLEMRNFQLNTDPVTVLRPVAMEYLDSTSAGSDSGTPKVYCVVRGEAQLGPIPDGEYKAEIACWVKVDPLTAANPTTDILTNHPKLYLYGTLRQAAIYLEDDEKLARYSRPYDDAVREVQIADERSRYSGPLQTRPVGITVA